jgi:hypothetical protein
MLYCTAIFWRFALSSARLRKLPTRAAFAATFAEQHRNSIMPRRPAKVTQSDIARAIRAAKSAGAQEVTVDCHGVIHIAIEGGATPALSAANVDESWTPSEALKGYLKRAETG